MNEPEWWPKVQKTARAYGVTERDRQNIEAILAQAHHGLTPIRSVQLEHFLVMGYEAGAKASMSLQRAIAWEEGFQAGFEFGNGAPQATTNPYSNLIPVFASGDGMELAHNQQHKPDDQHDNADGDEKVDPD